MSLLTPTQTLPKRGGGELCFWVRASPSALQVPAKMWVKPSPSRDGYGKGYSAGLTFTLTLTLSHREREKLPQPDDRPPGGCWSAAATRAAPQRNVARRWDSADETDNPTEYRVSRALRRRWTPSVRGPPQVAGYKPSARACMDVRGHGKWSPWMPPQRSSQHT